MLALLDAPEGWLGLGAVVAALVFVLDQRREHKREEARLQRVTRTQRGARPGAAAGLTLKRQLPKPGNPFMAAVSSLRSISKLQARLELAGMTVTPTRFIGISVGVALMVTLLVIVLFNKSFLIALPIGLLAGLGLPQWVVNRRIRKRHLSFLNQFPEAIDLMVRGLRAGLPIGESFITVSTEMPPPIGESFAAISQQVALGVPTEKALEDAAKKLDITEFNFFVTSIILQRETGGNLGEILSNLAEMLRQRHAMKLKIKALSSEARASAMIVGSLPFVVMIMLEVISPQYLRPLFADYRGNLALAFAAGMMSLGGFIMSKMTQLEI